MSDVLQIKMLGGFTVEKNGQSVGDTNNRMRKVWLLLAYLIYTRGSGASQENYLALLQGAGGEETADPNGRLKAMLYRVRTLLGQVEDNAGHAWIIRKNGTYAWNPDVPVTVDVEEFERLYLASRAAGSDGEKLECCRRALDLYRGDFLPKLSTEPWVMPITAYYHKMYLDAVQDTLGLLEGAEDWESIVRLCEQALSVEPYSEEIYQYLMRGRISTGDRTGALRAYEEMSEVLFSTFGVMPSDESRQLYRQASRESESSCVPVGTVREQLREPTGARGALYCEYDFFKLLYQVQARSILRSGDVIHIALFSVRGRRGKELARRSLDIAMDNLQEIIVGSLRQGDVVTRCSISQLIVMLPQANYENSGMVCQRILKAFERKHPHSPAEIHYSVQPLEPMLPHGQN